MIISFSGLDGSGKTTHSKWLREYLTSKKIKTKYIHLQKLSIFNSLSRLLGKISGKTRKKAESLEFDNKNSIIKFLLSIARNVTSFIDILVFDFIIITNPKKVIICDRYFYDLAVQSLYLNMSTRLISRIYLSIIPKPNIAFFLETSPKIALKRSREKTIDFHSIKKELYSDLISKNDFIFIKEWSLPETKKEIKGYIDDILNIQ